MLSEISYATFNFHVRLLWYCGYMYIRLSFLAKTKKAYNAVIVVTLLTKPSVKKQRTNILDLHGYYYLATDSHFLTFR